jgi:hypothetical protein
MAHTDERLAFRFERWQMLQALDDSVRKCAVLRRDRADLDPRTNERLRNCACKLAALIWQHGTEEQAQHLLHELTTPAVTSS